MSGLAPALVEFAGLAGVAIEPGIVEACAAHFALVTKWNRTHNLTRVVDARDAAARHYLDAIVPGRALVRGGSVLDVGSGAGFPGLVVALLWPAARFTLVEPAAKRASFLRVAIGDLGLRDRVEVRDRALDADTRADTVTSRATFPAGKRAALFRAAAGEVLLWGTGAEAAGWAAEAAGHGFVSSVLPYGVPGLTDHAILRAHRA